MKHYIIVEHLIVDDFSNKPYLGWALMQFDFLKSRYTRTEFADTREELLDKIEKNMDLNLNLSKLETLKNKINPEILEKLEKPKLTEVKKKIDV